MSRSCHTNVQPVGAFDERIEFGADLALAGRGDFVVVNFHFHALLLERKTHSIADVLQ
jgi:hypothetical protein